MLTFGTLFSGGELAGVGIRNAGLKHLWGIEIDPKIAQVARMNGFEGVVTADLLECDPHDFEKVYALHASPSCVNASQANSTAELNEDGTKESRMDIALAKKVAEFIDVLRPQIFTLENVFGYRKFKSFKIITDTLENCGYWWDLNNINAADYQVPQTRRRLIVRATLGKMLPALPPKEKWIGWLEAIADLIPMLPDSHFADWQLSRMPEFYKSMLVDSLNYSNENPYRELEVPAMTLTVYNSKHPAPKALLIGSENHKQEWSDGTREAEEPCLSLTQTQRPKAFVIDGKPSNVGGRVVSITPRALARFMSVPDWYILPDNATLACKILGNGVTCLMIEKIYRGLIA